MTEHRKKGDEKLQLWGWLLFIICALFFIAASIQADDVLTLIGSTIFLGACILFIIPLVAKRKGKEGAPRKNQ